MKKNPYIYITTNGADDWQKFLAEPKKQWKTGFSARTAAHCWEDSDTIPEELLSVLKQNQKFHSIKPLIILPERKTDLSDGRAASQSDIWVLARSGPELTSITVEAKVDESFDKTVGKWVKNSSSDSKKPARLERFSRILGLNASNLNNIYYQLIHRTVSAIIEAQQFGAGSAIMVIQSFSPKDKNFEAFVNFSNLFSIHAKKNVLHSIGMRDGIDTYVTWITGNQKYLTY